MFLVAKLVYVLLCTTTISVVGIPTWEGLHSRGSIGSLVPGASYIEGIGPAGGNDRSPRHLSVPFPGQPGNLTVIRNPMPSLFFINQNQLWQLNNETSILSVNVMNTTGTANLPLQLVLGNKPAGLRGGSWRWRGTMLHYDQGAGTNGGLFFTCPTESGTLGIFMFLKPSPAPSGCNFLTLHSFSRRDREYQ